MTLAKNYPAKTVCEVMGYSRSSYYYQSQQPITSDEEQALKEAVLKVAGQWPTYGYRRITAQLHREGWLINAKRLRRILKTLGLMAKPKVRKKRTTNSEHPYPRYPNLLIGLQVTHPEHVWVSDITYIRLGIDFVYLAVIMDVFTRAIRGWQLGRSLESSLTLGALQKALAERKPEIHHSDQGVQYAAGDYVGMLHAQDVAISMAEVGEPTQNGYAERLMRTIKEEEVNLSEYRNYQEVYEHIGEFLDNVYMHKRIHSALGYLTPGEFETQWQATQTIHEMIN
jgi:putative transposase